VLDAEGQFRWRRNGHSDGTLNSEPVHIRIANSGRFLATSRQHPNVAIKRALSSLSLRWRNERTPPRCTTLGSPACRTEEKQKPVPSLSLTRNESSRQQHFISLRAPWPCACFAIFLLTLARVAFAEFFPNFFLQSVFPDDIAATEALEFTAILWITNFHLLNSGASPLRCRN